MHVPVQKKQGSDKALCYEADKMFNHKHLQQKYYKALLYAMTYHDEVSISNFNAKLLLAFFCLLGFLFILDIGEASSM